MQKEVTSSPHSQHLTPAPGREVAAADKSLARNQDPVLQPLLLPHWRYGAMSPEQSLITLTHKATKALVPLGKAGTHCMVEGAATLTGCLFLPGWHGNKAQVCTWDKRRGHRGKKYNDFQVSESPGTPEPADSSSSSYSQPGNTLSPSHRSK